MDREIKVSKFLAKILRHSPEDIGIKLDSNGWANVDEILNNKKFPLTWDEMEYVVENNDKKRFAFNEDITLIRANQGHSVEVDLALEPKTPPQFLFHGTVEKFISSIMTEGLKKIKRHHVHFSQDIQTATKVGSRRGKPIILEVAAGAMHGAGHQFFLSANGVWLTEQCQHCTSGGYHDRVGKNRRNVQPC